MLRQGVKIAAKYHQTLCDAFRELQHTDAGCVLKLRKLQALPESQTEELLVRHFGSMVGFVHLHLIRPSTKPSKRGGRQLGFVVLRTPADAETVLSRGSQCRIADVTVTLERFEQAQVS
jgi:hypothetical protein